MTGARAGDRARADLILTAARRCIGTPFRPQGRQPGFALDCVGLVAIGYRATGLTPVLPQGYTLRGGEARAAMAMIEENDFVRIDPAHAGPADLLLLRPGARQLHLAIMAEGGFIHADAGLRRVVETPGRPPWPVLAAWRWTGIPES